MDKIAWDGPKWGQDGIFPANPDLADILGRTGFSFHNLHAFDFLGPMEKMVWGGPKWSREGLFPANPDLADMLGDMDLDFDNCDFRYVFGFQISGFPDFPSISEICQD